MGATTMPSSVSPRGLFRLAAGTATGSALGAPPPALPAMSLDRQSLTIEPYRAKRRGPGARVPIPSASHGQGTPHLLRPYAPHVSLMRCWQ